MFLLLDQVWLQLQEAPPSVLGGQHHEHFTSDLAGEGNIIPGSGLGLARHYSATSCALVTVILVCGKVVFFKGSIN